MRFAWLRKNTPDHNTLKRSNILWWVPMGLSFTGVIDYRTGFVLFFVVTVFRLCINVYVNYALDLDKFERFPLKA